MKSFKFGESSQKLPILGFKFGSGGPPVLILGGVHGDEVEGVIAANALISRFSDSFSYRLNLTIIPIFNPEGVFAGQRKNSNQVDLNRNLPTNDWTAEVSEDKYFPGPKANSEPENKALVEWLDLNKPRFVLSFHSWNPLLNINGNCHPEAEIIAKLTGYEVKESIGYPTPGCLGTYCGLEREMPTLTYEIERGLDASSIIKTHLPATLEALKITEERR